MPSWFSVHDSSCRIVARVKDEVQRRSISIPLSGLMTQIILQNHWLGSTAQRHLLLIEYRLDRLARCLDVEAVLLHQVAAIGQDGVGVPQHLQPTEMIVMMRPYWRREATVTSASPPTADIRQSNRHVRLVPKGDIDH
jgi:hypothetical protein